MDELPRDLPDSIRRAVDVLEALATAPDGEDGAEGDLVWIQTPPTDKYSHVAEVRIDCESRIHLCRAACCRLRFPLSEQDLEEGVVVWDPEHPYMIAQGSDGHCVHLERSSRRCAIYARRPLPCRAFDCRNDPRIWSDFERRIPNPTLHAGTPPTSGGDDGPLGDPRGSEDEAAVPRRPPTENPRTGRSP